jgi:hypothetical protein
MHRMRHDATALPGDRIPAKLKSFSFSTAPSSHIPPVQHKTKPERQNYDQ